MRSTFNGEGLELKLYPLRPSVNARTSGGGPSSNTRFTGPARRAIVQPMKRTVLRMLDEAAERWASRPYALRKTDDGYLAYSFTEIREGARRFAAWMLGQGFRAGDNLAILAEGGPEWIIAECGMLYARCVSVPLSIKLLVEEVSFRLDHSGAKAVIVSKNQLKKALAALKKERRFRSTDIIHRRRSRLGQGDRESRGY